MTRFSLRTRLLVGVVVLAAAGLVIADLATYSSLRSYLVGQVDTALNREAPIIAGRIWGGVKGPPLDGAFAPGYCVQVRGLDGRALGPVDCSPGLPGQAQLPSPKLPARISLPARPYALVGNPVHLTVPAVEGSGSYRVLAMPAAARMLVIAQPLDAVNDTLRRLLLIELLVTAAVLAALALLALWIIRLGLRPLRAIEATAAAITAGDLSRRVEHVAPSTEVGRVGGALNTMLDRIEASDKRLRRFVADASHELRTPLAAVRAYAELFGRGASAHPEDLERSMAGITRESERMTLLVDDLLLLARLDEGRPLDREPVDFAAVVSEAVEAAKAVEPERPISVSLDAATVRGDRDRLRQAVDNLFANVRAHTPAAAPVSVELRTGNGRAKLVVADRGPGLADDDAERIFERFYRVDASRARARASGGVGLGLSIVAAVVAAHGGSVEAEPTPGGGATFVIELPLAPVA